MVYLVRCLRRDDGKSVTLGIPAASPDEAVLAAKQPGLTVTDVTAERVGSGATQGKSPRPFRLILQVSSALLAVALVVLGLAGSNADVAAGGGLFALMFGLLFVDRFFLGSRCCARYGGCV